MLTIYSQYRCVPY